jgi:YVTN family beta-propeller protein
MEIPGIFDVCQRNKELVRPGRFQTANRGAEMTSRISRHALATFLAFGVIAAAVSAAAPDPNNPTGTHGLVMVDKLGGHIRFFDPISHTELSNLAIGVNPHELAISPDHKTAYIPVYGDGVYGDNPHPGHTIGIVDLVSRQVVGMIDVSPYIAPHGVQVDFAGTVYVTCDSSRKLLVINPKKRSIEAAIDEEGTGHWLVVLPDGSKAYVANKQDKPFVSVIDLKARKMVGRVPTPNGTQGLAASPDGKQVVVLDFVKPVMMVIDTTTDKIVDTIPLKDNPGGAYRVRFTPDGSKLLTNNESPAIVNILDASNLHGEQHVLRVGKDPMGFGFAPDGRTALVGNHGDGTVSIIDVKQARVTGNFPAGTGIEFISYY